MRNFIKDILIGTLAEVKDWLKAILGAIIIAGILFLLSWYFLDIDWKALSGK